MDKLETLINLLSEANHIANELGLDCQETLSDIQDQIAQQFYQEAAE